MRTMSRNYDVMREEHGTGVTVRCVTPVPFYRGTGLTGSDPALPGAGGCKHCLGRASRDGDAACARLGLELS